MAAKAVVDIFVQLRDLVTGPARAVAAGLRATFSGLTSSISGLRGLASAVVGGSFVVALKKLADADVAVARLAETTRSTTEEISILKFALDQLGVGSNNLKEILNQLEGKRGDALRGPSQTRQAFARLGVDLQELRTLGGAQILEELSAGFEALGRSSAAGAQLQAIFGDRFREFLPLLTQGRQGFKDLAKAAEEVGAVISKQDTEKAREFQQQVNKFAYLSQSVFRELATEIFPLLNNALADVIRLIHTFRGTTGNATRDEIIRLEQLQTRLSQPAGSTISVNEENLAALNRARASFESFGASGIEGETFVKVFNSEEVIESIQNRIAGLKDELKEAKAAQVELNDAQRAPPPEAPGFLAGFRAEIEATRTSLNEMFTQGQLVARELANVLSSNVSGVLRELRQGTLELKDALQALLDGLIEDLTEIATRELTTRLFNAALGFFAGGAAAGGPSAGGGGIDIPSPPGGYGASSRGGGLLGGGNRQLSPGAFGGGGGGSVINVNGITSSEEQARVVGLLMQHHLQRNRQVRVAAGVI